MRTWLITFLKLLEQTVVPTRGHHALSYVRFGTDAGWEDKLALHVWIDDTYTQTFFLTDDDFDRPIADVVAEVRRTVTEVRGRVVRVERVIPQPKWRRLWGWACPFCDVALDGAQLVEPGLARCPSCKHDVQLPSAEALANPREDP